MIVKPLYDKPILNIALEILLNKLKITKKYGYKIIMKYREKNTCIQKQIYKMYHRYIKYIVSYERHIERIYTSCIIDIDTRDKILKKLDRVYKLLLKKYQEFPKDRLNYDKISNNEQFNIDIYINDHLQLLNKISGKSEDNDDEIKNVLVSLSDDNGSLTIKHYLKLCLGKMYKQIISKKVKNKIKKYNNIFVPLIIEKGILNHDTSFSCHHTSFIECDSIIGRECTIQFNIENQKMSYRFYGYIECGSLNIYPRSCHILNYKVFQKRIRIQKKLAQEYPQVDTLFQKKYFKTKRISDYIFFKEQQLIENILSDYQQYQKLRASNFNSIVKDFINHDIQSMHKIIELLMLGGNESIRIASILFDLLKDEKNNGDTVKKIIYNNLSFYYQNKMKRDTSSLYKEMKKIKKISIDNISIEKQIAAVPNLPECAKIYIMEKNDEWKSGENSYKLQMAINGLLQFPWKRPNDYHHFSNIKNSLYQSRCLLERVETQLNDKIFGHCQSKNVLKQLVGKWIYNPESTGQVIGLVGPPGVGKTLFAKSLSKALNIPLSVIGLGGMSDASDLIGHSFTYSGAQYGMIIRQMIKAGKWRSIMFFDEVDKVSKKNDTNEIYNSLIHITDPNMNQKFQDRFFPSIEFDLSGLLIVFSYNDSSKIDPILLDRVKEINISAYSLEEKVSIAKKFIVPELCENIGLNKEKISISDKNLRYLVDNYTLESGVRDLKRKLEQILLKLNMDRFYFRGPYEKMLRNASNNNDSSLTVSQIEDLIDKKTLEQIFLSANQYHISLDIELINSYLDDSHLFREKIHQENSVGIVNGLYATSSGTGGIVPIQITKNNEFTPNKKLKITGNQKEVMKESVECALTAAINILDDNVKNNIYSLFPNGFHVHTPDGGTPKDGPSAGCAFATAFISVILDKKVNRKIGMTGEIDLSGKISKIGGLCAKINGAKRAGIETVFICKENESDWAKIIQKDPQITNNFKVKIVEHLRDIIFDPELFNEFDN